MQHNSNTKQHTVSFNNSQNKTYEISNSDAIMQHEIYQVAQTMLYILRRTVKDVLQDAFHEDILNGSNTPCTACYIDDSKCFHIKNNKAYNYKKVCSTYLHKSLRSLHHILDFIYQGDVIEQFWKTKFRNFIKEHKDNTVAEAIKDEFSKLTEENDMSINVLVLLKLAYPMFDTMCVTKCDEITAEEFPEAFQECGNMVSSIHSWLGDITDETKHMLVLFEEHINIAFQCSVFPQQQKNINSVKQYDNKLYGTQNSVNSPRLPNPRKAEKYTQVIWR